MLEVDGFIKYGNDRLSLEVDGSIGLGVIGKVNIGTKSDKTVFSLESGFGKTIKNGVYVEGDIKIKGSLLEPTKNGKDEFRPKGEESLNSLEGDK